MAPGIATAVGRGDRKRDGHVVPPDGRSEANRRQREQVAGVTKAGSREGIGDGGPTVHGGEREALRVEAVVPELRGCAQSAHVAPRTNRVQRALARHVAQAFDVHHVRTDDVADSRPATGAKIQHTAPAGVPKWRAFALDIRVQRVGKERAVRRLERDGGRGPPRRLLVGLLVGTDGMIVGVQPGVFLRQLRHDAVAEHHGRVTRADVSPVDALAEQVRALKGVVVVHHVQLEEASSHPRELEGRSARPNAAGVARHPKDRISGGQHEIGDRRSVLSERGLAPVTARGGREKHEREYRREVREAHCRRI